MSQFELSLGATEATGLLYFFDGRSEGVVSLVKSLILITNGTLRYPSLEHVPLAARASGDNRGSKQARYDIEQCGLCGFEEIQAGATGKEGERVGKHSRGEVGLGVHHLEAEARQEDDEDTWDQDIS